MEGYVLVDNGRLTEKEARMNMEQCADFLARMIQKWRQGTVLCLQRTVPCLHTLQTG